ncbi:MAG: serine hydrolase [Streptosporangiaceae bacterium]
MTAAASAGCTVVGPPPTSHHDPSSRSRSSAPGRASRSASPSRSHRPHQVSPFVALAGYLASRHGTITAAVYDRNTGQTWVYHPGVAEETASIVKVEILGAALRKAAQSGNTSPTALPQDQQALIPTMIENSDNTAATEMYAKVGGASGVKTFDLAAGLHDTQPSSVTYIPGTTLPGWGLTTTTARDEVTLVRRFAYRNPLLSDADRAYGLSLMEHVESDQAWGVSGGVPGGTTVALKNGWLPLAGAGWQVNSIGWVDGHGRNYVLAVLTSHNPDEPYGIDTITAIAAKMYAALGPHHQ